MNTLWLFYLSIATPIIAMYVILATVMLIVDFISWNDKFSLFIIGNIVIHRLILVIWFILWNILFIVTHQKYG